MGPEPGARLARFVRQELKKAYLAGYEEHEAYEAFKWDRLSRSTSEEAIEAFKEYLNQKYSGKTNKKETRRNHTNR